MTDTTDTRDIVDFPHADIIDSRQIHNLDFGDEINAEVKDAANYSADWHYGETLIASSYFTEYAKELAEDIGAINPDAAWPLWYIDWDRAADALAQDYTLVTIDSRDYYIR